MVDQESENLAELCPRNFTEIKRAFVRTAKYLQTRSEDFIYSLQPNCGVGGRSANFSPSSTPTWRRMILILRGILLHSRL
jgi:hypothetical protein